jgi:DNA-binding SARP family transcriptional activator
MTDMLTITTLGGLSIRLDDEPVTGLASRKVEALLVYLACTGRPRPREVVAEMLWEERSQSQALANLRVVLSSLRKHLALYVTINRDTVALNPDADVWLDAAELEHKLAAGHVEEAVALYHGDFLEGFSSATAPTLRTGPPSNGNGCGGWPSTGCVIW